MAKQCYQIPRRLDAVGHAVTTRACRALARRTMPDGTKARDGAGFAGQFWVNALWVEQG